MIEQIPTTSILTVLTCRPTFQPSWSHRSYLTEITVNRLSHTVETDCASHHRWENPPNRGASTDHCQDRWCATFRRGDNQAILESGHLKEVDGQYERTGSFVTFAIPATLHDSLMARLDRLSDRESRSAICGGDWTPIFLCVAASGLATRCHDVTAGGRAISQKLRLCTKEGCPQSTYVFKHALIQDAVASLLKNTRQQYHQQIAQVLERSFQRQPETT